MPRGDGTGPMGMGPMTGRAAGFCAGFNVPGFANVCGRGGGFGRGFGRGMGMRRMMWFGQTSSFGPNQQAAADVEQDELVILEKQAKIMSQNMEQIQRRIEELRKEKNNG